MLIGYARVSTNDQNLDLQVDALTLAGCDRIFSDTMSGAKDTRPGLGQALSHLRQGDTLIVWRLDRLGRSLNHLVSTVDNLSSQNILFKSLVEGIDTSTSIGKLHLGIFAALAEFERNLIRERTLAGLAAAKSRGRVGGRPKKQKDSVLVSVRHIATESNASITEVCADMGISKSTYYRRLKQI